MKCLTSTKLLIGFSVLKASDDCAVVNSRIEIVLLAAAVQKKMSSVFKIIFLPPTPLKQLFCWRENKTVLVSSPAFARL